MIRKGSLVEYIGTNKALVHGKTYMVHDVNDTYAWLWVRNDKFEWTKKRVPVEEIKLVVVA